MHPTAAFETKRDAVGWAINAGGFFLRSQIHQPKAAFRWAEASQSLFHYELRGHGMTKLAMFADAGTGLYHSRYIGRHIMAEEPEQAIYLGDVYYAGKSDEFGSRFLGDKDFRRIIDSTPLFTLNANHEMFSGGRPYLAAIDARRRARPALHDQEGSYFSLRNGTFQVIGIDTAAAGARRRQELRPGEYPV